jgi:hypothetical protein
VIEEAGHLCVFLSKFHCELNFIEFFWGTVKKYLRENCDYTFDTLKANMPKKPCHLSQSRPFGGGNIICFDGQRLTSQDSAQMQLRCRFEILVQQNANHRHIPEVVARALN